MFPKKREISLGFSNDTFEEGHHILYVYNSDVERKKTVAKYLQQGLLDDEKVLCLVSDISTTEMRKELRDLGVDVDKKQKDIDLTPGHYAHCPDCTFSGEYMLSVHPMMIIRGQLVKNPHYIEPEVFLREYAQREV